MTKIHILQDTQNESGSVYVDGHLLYSLKSDDLCNYLESIDVKENRALIISRDACFCKSSTILNAWDFKIKS